MISSEQSCNKRLDCVYQYMKMLDLSQAKEMEVSQ